MAYTARDFHRDLAIFSAGGILGPTRSRKLIAYAGRKGIQLAGLAAARAAPAAAAHPIGVGTALGLGALATPPGQDLLAAAAEHGRQSRILFERAQQEMMTTPQQLEAALTSAPVSVATVVPRIRKRAVSKFNKAVSAGMKVVKQAKTYGGKGKIKPGKKAFTLVTKIASAKKKKRKAPKSGIRRKIWNAMKGLR
jgi:hypothetical protein